MSDYLDKLAETALQTIQSGYYQTPVTVFPSVRPSFVKAIRADSKVSLIAEVKPASPSGGRLLGDKTPREVVDLFAETQVTGLSVLTEPVHFGGSLDTLRYAASKGFPILFKDFVLNVIQLDAARQSGASAVLLILALFERGYANVSMEAMIAAATERGLEVLLEVYNAIEYQQALTTLATMIGINNRDLKTLRVDLNATKTILENHLKDRVVWSLSGINSVQDLDFLRQSGADAFLIGTALMKSKQPRQLLQTFGASLG